MKNFLTCVLFFSLVPFLPPSNRTGGHFRPIKNSDLPRNGQHLVIVTIDGLRWQEIFLGADKKLISQPGFTPDTAMASMLYWSDNLTERRQKLMPFFWNVVAKRGQLYGNREAGSRVNTSNIYSFSYPGYNEIFTGNTDVFVSSNKKRWNPNVNVLEYLHGKEAFKGKVVAFSSWDVFPYILNEKRSGMLVNSGFETVPANDSSATLTLINNVQGKTGTGNGTRQDALTFLTAGEYMKEQRPRVIFIGLGETDECAHNSRYDLYLQKANQADRLLAGLWQWIQTTDGYRDNTSLVITTDHGRGKFAKSWSSHSSFIRGSSETWLALMGPGLSPLGEVKDSRPLYQRQIAGLIAEFVGEEFGEKMLVSGFSE